MLTRNHNIINVNKAGLMFKSNIAYPDKSYLNSGKFRCKGACPVCNIFIKTFNLLGNLEVTISDSATTG